LSPVPHAGLYLVAMSIKKLPPLFFVIYQSPLSINSSDIVPAVKMDLKAFYDLL